MLNAQQWFSWLCRWFLHPQQHVAPHHHARNLFLVRLFGYEMANHLAPAQHRDIIGDFQHLTQLMGDENNRLAAFHQSAQHDKEIVGLLWRQHAGRLIENQDIGAAIQHFENLDPLLQTNRQIAGAGAGINRQPILRRKFADIRVSFGCVEDINVVDWLATQRDILTHRQWRDQHKVLMHHADAKRNGVAWARDVRQLAIDIDFTGIWAQQTVEDVHQRGFAGAVLADQRVNLPLLHSEAHIIVGNDPWPCFTYIAHLDGDGSFIAGHRLRCLRCCCTHCCTLLYLHQPSSSRRLLGPRRIWLTVGGGRYALADQASQYDQGEDVWQHAQQIAGDVQRRVVGDDGRAKPKYQAGDERADGRPLAKDHRCQRDIATSVGHAVVEDVGNADGQERAGQAGEQAAGDDGAVANRIDVDAGCVRCLWVLANGTDAQAQACAEQHELHSYQQEKANIDDDILVEEDRAEEGNLIQNRDMQVGQLRRGLDGIETLEIGDLAVEESGDAKGKNVDGNAADDLVCAEANRNDRVNHCHQATRSNGNER